MSERRELPGPQFRAERVGEQEAVRTTIVGGRPPGSGKTLGQIPRGIEVLVKKASVDPQFKAMLMERRADAAGEIGLSLEPVEAMMLASVPQSQLEAIIARTVVPDQQRRVFLGKVAAAMLAAVGASAVGCSEESELEPAPAGIAPDLPPAPPEASQPPSEASQPSPQGSESPAEGSQPPPHGSTRKESKVMKIVRNRPSRGIRPD